MLRPLVALLAVALVAPLLAGCVVEGEPSALSPPTPTALIAAPPADPTPDATPTSSAPTAASPPPRPPPPVTEDEMRARWMQERTVLGPSGVEATLDVRTSDWTLRAPDGVAETTTPREVRVAELFPDDRPLLFLGDVTANGVPGAWLVLEGASIRLSGGRVFAAGLASLDAAPGAPFALGLHGDRHEDASFVDWPDANRSFFFAESARLRLEGVAVSGFARATLYAANGTPTPLAGELLVTSDRAAWDARSTVVAERWSAEVPDVSMGGNATSGRVQPVGRAAIERPSAVFGEDAKLVLANGSVSSVGSFRMTQAIDAKGLVLPAKVEVWSMAAQEVRVARNATTWVPVVFRERSAQGDAVIENVTLDGATAPMVSLPLAAPPSAVQQVFDETLALGPIAAIAVVPLALAAPFIALAEGLACFFGPCPHLHPFPSWMGAGEVGTAYLRVEGTLAPGTYEGNVWIRGQNYEDVVLPVRVTVE